MTHETNILDKVAFSSTPNFAEMMPLVTSTYGKSLSSQLKDIVMLCMRGNKLKIDEYYQMRLFDHHTYSDEARRSFVGLDKSRQIWQTLLQGNTWCSVVDDKLAYETLMRGFGFSMPTTLAVFGGNYPNNIPKRLETESDLVAFFSSVDFPLFGKPLNSNQSLGSARFEGFESESNLLTLASGEQASVEQLANEILNNYDGRYLFQQCLEAHPVMQGVCGEGLPTARIVTVNRGNGPELYRACMKITGNGNVADNFWRSGNLLSAIDIESGKLEAALTCMGVEGEFVSQHPDTHQNIEGLEVPFWEAACNLALTAHELMNDCLLFGFDIAICENGPVLIEANYDPHLIMLQIAHKKGVLDGPILDAMSYADERQKHRNSGIKKFLAEEKLKNSQDLKDATKLKAA